MASTQHDHPVPVEDLNPSCAFILATWQVSSGHRSSPMLDGDLNNENSNGFGFATDMPQVEAHSLEDISIGDSEESDVAISDREVCVF